MIRETWWNYIVASVILVCLHMVIKKNLIHMKHVCDDDYK